MNVRFFSEMQNYIKLNYKQKVTSRLVLSVDGQIESTWDTSAHFTALWHELDHVPRSEVAASDITPLSSFFGQ